jgi:hypothetical protein
MGAPKTRVDTVARIAKRRKERMTPKQIKFLHNLNKAIFENKGLEKITYGEVLRKSGYSESIANNPKQVLEAKAIRPEMQHIVDKFMNVRDRAIEHLTDKKLEEAKGMELAQIADKFQKNINLLIGESTANISQKTIRLDLTALNNNG